MSYDLPMSLFSAFRFKLLFALIFISSSAAYAEKPVKVHVLTHDGITLTIPNEHMAPVYNRSYATAWIYMMYPNFKPLKLFKPDLQAAIESGEVIDFSLAIEPPEKPRTSAYVIEMKKNKADKKIGEEFGLDIYSQTDTNDSHHPDIWVDSQEEPSFIVCSESEELKNSICSHYLYPDSFQIVIFYSRDKLNDWKNIKMQVLSLYDGYKNYVPEDAAEGTSP